MRYAMSVAAAGAAGFLVGRAALAARHARARRPSAAWRSAPELIQSALVDGVLMRWEEHGEEGPPVVLLHGLPTSPRLWRFVLSELAPDLDAGRLRCFAWELVGFGHSAREGLGRDVSLAAQTEHLAAFLDALDLRRTVLVGHDLGGGVAQRLAVLAPERVAGLVLVDSVAYRAWPAPPVRVARRAADWIERAPTALLGPLLAATLRWLGHRAPAEASALYRHAYAGARGARALAHQLRALDPRDTDEVGPALRELALPARVVWGERDPLGVCAAARLARDLEAPLELIPGAGHFTPEEHPDAVARAIREVVAEAELAERRVRPGRTSRVRGGARGLRVREAGG